MELPRPVWFTDLFAQLLTGQDLDPARCTDAFRDILGGHVEDAMTAALLTGLRIKGESSDEIAAVATALREQMLRLVPVSGPVVDTCGTGGDETGTFNISTAAAFVTAAAGVPVVKHGNRAVSSRSGSADVLRELGVNIEQGPTWAQKCLDRVGFAFCFAPHFHPGMSHVAALRRKLGVRTIFNLVGPLANPAGSDYQLLGVGKYPLLDPLAGAIARLGTRQAILVCGHDGLDEVTLAAPTHVRMVEGDEFRVVEWTPADFGLAPVALSEIHADDAAASAAMVRQVLQNEDIPARRIVLANAAAALYAAEAVTTLKDGVALAEDALASGRAHRVLERLQSTSVK